MNAQPFEKVYVRHQNLIAVGTGKRVQVGDVRINVVDEGNGPTVLLLHGFPESCQHWRFQVDRALSSTPASGLSLRLVLLFVSGHRASGMRGQVPDLVRAGFRVIAPDLRGFGESDKPQVQPWTSALPLLVRVQHAGAEVSIPQHGLKGWIVAIAQEVEAYKTQKIVSDVLGVLDAIGAPDKFHLVGHDWGASFAWTIAALMPERCAA